MSTGGGGDARTVGFAALLRVREFRVLWLADVQSLLGDQVARVALSVLVFGRTGSGLLTAAVYALTFLPALLGSLLLGGLADRLPRRALLVAGDLTRAGLLAVMAVPAVPTPVVAGLLVVAVLIGAPWSAAESALVVDILPAGQYPLGTAWRAATAQAAQLAGFVIGGITVAILGPSPALALDAATFAVSAAVITAGIRPRPSTRHDPGSGRTRTWGGAGRILSDPRLRTLLGFSWVLGLLVVPEGLAAPYAATLDAGPAAVGLLLAATPAGVLAGTLLYARALPTPRRAALLGPLATGAGLPLIACALHPGLVLTCLLWASSGAATAYQVQVVTEFVTIVPPDIRGQGIALATAGLLAAQGLGLLAGGALTQISTPTTAIALTGAAAVAAAAALTATRHHAAAPPPRAG